jgi:dihydroneopterin aldolase
MSHITIVDLEVFYHVGAFDEERAVAQRLLVSVEMAFDFSAAAMNDYNDVAKALLTFGEGRSWKLIEKVATDIANLILTKFRPEQVTVEVKKFIIPQTRYVSVSLTKTSFRR